MADGLGSLTVAAFQSLTSNSSVVCTEKVKCHIVRRNSKLITTSHQIIAENYAGSTCRLGDEVDIDLYENTMQYRVLDITRQT